MGRAPATPSIFIKSMSTLYDSEPPWSEAPDPLPWSGRLAAGQAHGRENWPKAYLGVTLPRRLWRRRHRLQSTYGPGDHKGHIPGTHTHHMAKKSVTLLYLAGVTALRPTLGMLGLPRPGTFFSADSHRDGHRRLFHVDRQSYPPHHLVFARLGM